VFQSADGFPLQPIITGRYQDAFARAGNAWRSRAGSSSSTLSVT
jgi:hypothetical protein